MNYQNNYWGGNGMGMNYAYNRPKMATPTNPLTKEEMAMLKQKAPQFTLAISQVDSLKAICTHRDAEGEKLQPNSDGTVTCTICGTKFRPAQLSEKDVEGVCETMFNILETIKIMYMDIPDEVTKGIFQMTPFILKTPQLYQIAMDHYKRYNNPSLLAGNYNNTGNTYALFSSMMSPGMMGMGMNTPQQMVYQQPGMAPVQPMMMYQQPTYQQPPADVTMGAVNGGNPFDANSPAVASAQQVTDNKQFQL